MAVMFLNDTGRRVSKKFDYIGFITSTIAMVSILYVLGEGSNIDWNDIKNPMLMLLGIFSTLLFIINELGNEEPLMELRVLNNFDFSISQIIQSILMFVLMGGMYVMPVFLENIRGYTAMETGIILLPSAIGQAFMMPISGKIFDKIGAKIPGIVGISILIISSYELAFINQDTSKFYIEVIMTIRSMGIGLSFMPVTTSGLNAVETKLAGQASSLNNTIKQIAGALGVTIMTTMIQSKCNSNYGTLSDQITPFNTAASSIANQISGLYIQNGYSNIDANSVTTYTIAQFVYRQAYIDSIDYALAAATVAAGIALIAVCFIKGKKLKKED